MTAGSLGYFGYEYQFTVSALLLLLAYKDKPKEFIELEIETAFGQDAAINFSDSTQHEDVNLALTQTYIGSSIQIQIKTRARQYQWAAADIREIFSKQDESVSSKNSKYTVLDRLAATPNEIFIFITDGMVAPIFAGLLADDVLSLNRRYPTNNFNECLDALTRNSSELSDKLTENILKRFYIFDGLKIEDVQARIYKTLTQDYSLPIGKVTSTTQDCINQIRNCAIQRNRVSISAQELINITGAIYTVPFPYIDQKYCEMPYEKTARQIIEEENVLLLIGEPALGKSTLARHIANRYSQLNYSVTELSGTDAYREILIACRRADNIIFVYDDLFGYENYDGTLATVVGNQFEELTSQIGYANGKVKLIVTSRSQVLHQAINYTKLSQHQVKKYLLEITYPQNHFVRKILESRIQNKLQNTPATEELLYLTEHKRFSFENLLHVSDFASQLEAGFSSHQLDSIFEESRPSLYLNWLAKQQPEIQLFMFALSIIQEINQFVKEEDLAQVFEMLASCIKLPPYYGFGSYYHRCLNELLLQTRIIRSQATHIDFSHPLIRTAVRNFFEKHSTVTTQISCLIETFGTSDGALLQSTGVALAFKYYGAGIQPATLYRLFKSRYLQVRDAFIRFGTLLLSPEYEDNKNELHRLAQDVYGREISPADCELNEDGELLIKESDEGIHFYNMEELAFRARWDLGIAFRKDAETEILENAYAQKDYSHLSPFQRYFFVDFITEKDVDELDQVLPFIIDLAYDPTSFVRKRVAKRLVKLVNAEITDNLLRILQILCFDNSPFVKLSALENTLIKIWASQTEEIQAELLDIVNQMLDDSVVRFRSAKGLVDQSGSLYYYHKEHSEAQKQLWFKSIALKLLNFRFDGDNLERYLNAFDKYYVSFDKDFRLELISALERYASRNPEQTTTLAYTITNIVFSGKTFNDENAILLRLMNKLPPLSKAYLAFKFAREIDKLPDKDYTKYVERIFFVERTDEYIFERAAAILGFLSNKATGNYLPEPIHHLGRNRDEAISNYINAQDRDFKLALIFSCFGYEIASEINVATEEIYKHPKIKELVFSFLKGEIDDESQLLVSDVILRSGYYAIDYHSSKHKEWFKYVNIILKQENEIFLCRVIDTIFADNIASSVHNISDWLDILAQLLKHPVKMARDYTAFLFDTYFHTIFLEHVSSSLEPARKKTNRLSDWKDPVFLEYLVNNCPLFKEFIVFNSVLRTAMETWDMLNDEDQTRLLNLVEITINPQKYAINEIIESFLQAMKGRIPDDKWQELLSKVIETDNGFPQTLGRNAYLNKQQSLRKAYPAFDWAAFFSS